MSVARPRHSGSDGEPDRTECPPESVGMDAAGLARAVDLVEARGAVAQLCVLRGGRVVLDRSVGCAPDSLFWIFSASKPYVAIIVHLLAERGLLALDDPVAAHWPEFARHGKESITVRHVLQHRSGLPTAGSALGDVSAMTDWDRCVRRIEQARPRWSAGSAPAYQFLSFGHILGELVRRVTAVPVRELVITELLRPIGVRDSYLGLPDEQWPRHVPVRGRGLTGACVEAVLNRRSTRRAVIPAAGMSTTAHDLATFYLMLLRAGEIDGTRVLRPSTVEQARTPSNAGELDRYARAPIRWSHGFQLGGPRSIPGTVSPMGSHSSTRSFGHNGSNCCIAWADPDRDLVFAYLTNLVTSRYDAVRHHARLADTVIDACREPIT